MLLETCLIAFVVIVHRGDAFRLSATTRRHRNSAVSAASNSPSSPDMTNILSSMTDTIKDIFSLKKTMVSKVTGGSEKKDDASQYDEEIKSTKAFLVTAAETKSEESDKVVNNLLSLEKLMRAKSKLDDGATSRETLKNLNGAWRLIFTTGTIDTQKKYGKVNYFPIKAAQCFDTSTMTLTNGIFLGDFAVLKFFGDFEWKEKARKLEFDFDAIAVLGLKFNLPKGGAAKIGSSTGLGSDNNVELVEKGNKPFFNWISADADIATARGGGGGLALWKRDADMEAANAAEKQQAAASS